PSNRFCSSRPTGVQVFVRPNAYEAGRANVTVFNWDLAGSASVNLSAVLSVGQGFEIRNAHDFFGAPVVTGTYTGGNVSIPMTGLSVAAPVGWAAPPNPGPEFGAFVVLPASPGGTPTPTVAPPTNTPTKTATKTPTVPAPTSTATPTKTPTVPAPTSTATPTKTPTVPAPTSTATKTPTKTPPGAPPPPTNTFTPTATATMTPTPGAPLPPPWVHQDIGAVGIPGSAVYGGGTFTINASGIDIDLFADEFHYVNQPLSGNGTIVAKVTSLQNTSPWATP